MPSEPANVIRRAASPLSGVRGISIDRAAGSCSALRIAAGRHVPTDSRGDKREEESMAEALICPQCGTIVETWRNPAPTVDIIIHSPDRGVVLIERGGPPYGLALPGGFVETGESAEEAAVREALEETGLHVELEALLGVYSDPARDPRRHTLSTVYIASTREPERLAAGDDAAAAAWRRTEDVPGNLVLAFDHAHILEHFKAWLRGERPAAAVSGKG